MRIQSLVVLALVLGVAGMASAQDWPDSMAVLGDSISRGVFADDTIGGLDSGQPEHCWSTGYESGDGVLSHYERILASNAGISGNNNNLAVSGAEMDDLAGQANNAVTAGVEYVTVFLGGNDVCAGDISGITSGATYESEFQAGVDILTAGLPDATILVCAAPDVYHLWDVGNGNFWCRLKWAIYGFCDSVLRSNSTDRATARAATIDYNTRLASVCATEGLIYDSGSYDVQFARGDLSNVDCFHPAKSAQQMLAVATYDASRF